ncbi:metallophosphoesterase [Flagellimonas meridianipacifica]|uniref:Calcineurin-like phosphoesterase family protein n=1 Tax=Flagellimonas meridianipacifica TaxID=1080225 RepID=A0A2T0MIT5_9FLAO|nr:metallophosphoesterase [Allomuricauda pacifica]PRX57465.1 calcineurin-like phosphoesterase family protein [Allomuricauda pacifica]
MKKHITFLSLVLVNMIFAQNIVVPKSHSNIKNDENGLFLEDNGQRYYASAGKARYSLEQLFGNPQGTEEGVTMDFGDFEGTITYGLIPYGKAPHPLPVFRFVKTLESGKADINIKRDFRYPYDFVDWQKNQILSIGYRLADEKGMVVYDGEVSLTGAGPFSLAPSIYEGPFINLLTDASATIWFSTTQPIEVTLQINDESITSPSATHHEIAVSNLKPDTKYEYSIKYGNFTQEYHLKTAPKPGSKTPFVFAYTSDSRHASGGGERKIYGANAYIMKKIAAVAYANDAAFMQFSGDLINGYLQTNAETQVQYTNWKKAVEPFWHYMPFQVGMGNHEALGHIFRDSTGRSKGFVDKFPYDTESAEASFAQAFVNPISTLKSEDGSTYDPSPQTIDFPSYSENVFHYRYDNVAVVVLNSDYWYAPSLSRNTATSGGLHGYIMDNQLEWLENTILSLEKDDTIDHIFVTQHTPAFPNGGHSRDDMWYSGNNEKRPFVAGKPLEKGIIERRDQYLNILINKSKKVLAILTGDEHNYNRLKLTDEVTIYPEDYPHEKLNVSRPIYQINNGAAGAPYYAQEVLPWSEHTKAFSVENAVCLFYVDGKTVKMKVVNPDTLNLIDEIVLR